jgi:hypothetical protein
MITIVEETRLPVLSLRQTSAVPFILLYDKADHLSRITSTTDGFPLSHRFLSLRRWVNDSLQPDSTTMRGSGSVSTHRK